MQQASGKTPKSRADKQKAIKRSAVDVSNVPTMTALPGNIDPLQFAKARTAEVLLLKQEIEESRHRNVRRVFQTLPRSMRRRVASYNIKRLPVRLRLKAMEEAAKDPATVQKAIKKPPCRRRRRRPKNIAAEFARRQTTKLWLETHMWHCKRAKMVDMWGYRIALNSNEKVLKSCIRASDSGCFLYDSSYLEVVEVPLADEEKLSRLMVLSSSSRVSKTDIYSESGIILGPVIVIRTESSIKLLIHPLMRDDVMSALRAIECSFEGPHKGLYSIFRMEGEQVLPILGSIFKCKLDDYFDSPWLFEDPRFDFPQTPQNSFDNGFIPPTTSPCFWDVKWNEEQVAKRKTQHQLNTANSNLLIPGTKQPPTDEDPKMPTLIANIGDTNQYIIVVPKGWGMPLWRSLIFMKGVRFGGLKEWEHVQLEHGRRVFPRDYSPSPAFKRWTAEHASTLLDQWNRRPPSKRVNYEAAGIASPFAPDTSLPITGQYLLESTSKGVPQYNAQIMSAEDGIIIGYVTSGCYSQRHGKGIAIVSLTLSNVSLPLKVLFHNVNGVPREATITKQVI